MPSEDAVIGPRTKLSRIQEQLWLAERLGLHATAYSVPLFLGIKGPVDEDALTSSLLDIVTRHEVLRTRIFEEDGELRGELRPPTDFTVEIRQSSTSDPLNGGGLDAVLAAEAGTPLDVSQGIPLRAKLIRIAEDERILSLVLHHLVFDDWSRNLFYGELTERYRARTTGSGAAARPLAEQYQHYAVRADGRNVRTRESSLGYWRPVLEHLVPFEIQPDFPRASRRRGRGAATGFAIAAEPAASIRRIGNARDASRAMVLFTAVAVALSRFTGRNDVSFGAPVAARDDDEAQELIGPLINTVVVRADLSGDPPFTELVERMRDTLLDAIEHSRMPFGELAAEFGAVGDLSRNPLTQIIVQYASGVRRRPELEGCEVRELPVPSTGSKYDLGVLFDEFDDGRLAVGIGWDSDLYAADTIQGFTELLRSVIGDIVRAPQTRCSAIRAPAARAEPEVPAPRRGSPRAAPGLSLAELVAVRARTRPAALAVVPDGGRPCTYAELDSMADHVATLLSLSGIRPEAIVAVHARQSVAQVAAVLGVVKAGAVCLTLGPDDSAEWIRSVLQDSGTGAILYEDGLPPDVRDIVPVCLGIGNIRDRADESQRQRAGRVHQDGACALVYPAGSVAGAKGVVLTHRGLTDRIAALQADFPLRPSDLVLIQASSALDLSVAELFRPLTVGAAVLLARPGGHLDPPYLVDRIIHAGATVANLTPTVLAVIAGDCRLPACDGLRMIMVAGGELRQVVFEQFRARLPGCEIHDGYELPEASVGVSRRRCGADGADGSVTEVLGTTLPGTRAYVLDGWLNPAPPGGAGELCVGGPGLARGYLGLPGLTAELFVPDPAAIGERLYRTGDIVRYLPATKSYRFLGRRDLKAEDVAASHPDRRSLPDIGAAALSPTADTETMSEHRRGLLEIWREVLGRDDIVATSNFFTSGGHSLVAIQMTNRTRERFAMDVPLSLVFEAPVFNEFSDRVAELVSCLSTGDRIGRLT